MAETVKEEDAVKLKIHKSDIALRKKIIPAYVLQKYLQLEQNRKIAEKYPEYWIQCQNKQIRLFVNRIYRFSFYRRRFEKAGIRPEDIRCAADFLKLPPLTKEEYRKWTAWELAHHKERYEGWLFRKTTGSSGLPLELRSTPEDRAYEIANLFRCAVSQKTGYNPFTGRIFSTMVPEPVNLYKSIIPFRAQMSSIEEPAALVEGYNKAKPDFYYGNKTAVLMIAKYALDHGIKLHQPRCVGTISEPLDENARALMDSAFGSGRVFDFYGCAESGNFAADRVFSPYNYTIWHDTHVVNVLHPERISGGLRGEMLLTSLVHYGFPLVNYLTEDLIEVKDDRGVRSITRILGRTNDVILNRDGSTFHWMHIERIMHGIIDIIQFRVIQDNYDELQFVIAGNHVSVERKNEIEKMIQERMDGFFGTKENAKKAVFVWCDSIPPDPNGKIRILINRI